ncbi:MAG TPA: hypothetical protein VFR84_14910 [Candidatus Angelobacter sp.]|nr:hypothetical protein [Candidatus Angelobacter sp.]
MKMQLPASVTPDPNARDLCVAGHGVISASGSLGGVIDQSGDISGEKCNVRLNDLHRRQRAVLVKLFDESQDLIPVPYVLFNVGEVREKQLPKICGVSIHVRFPKGIFLLNDRLRRIRALREGRHTKEQHEQYEGCTHAADCNNWDLRPMD